MLLEALCTPVSTFFVSELLWLFLFFFQKYSVVEELNSDIYKLKILIKLKSTLLISRYKCVEI